MPPVNRLRTGLTLLAVTGTLAMASCATSAPHLGGGAPPTSVSLPPVGPLGPSTDPSDGPSGAPTPTSVSTSAPTATSTHCAWGPSGNPANASTGTPATSVPDIGAATMSIFTNDGTITIALNRAATPCTVASFAYLAGRHFFDETACHRITTTGIYILQCGDPTGSGNGGPSYTIPDEALPPAITTTVNYPRGTVAMANTGQPNTGGSQFFLVYKDSPLPPTYTIFGTITDGTAVLDEIAAAGVASGGNDGAPKLPVKILSLTITGA